MKKKKKHSMTETLTLGNVSTKLAPVALPDGSGQFLYFNLNNMPEFVEEGARLVAERVKELKLTNPYFVTPETSTISMAHVLRTKYNIDGIGYAFFAFDCYCCRIISIP